MTPFRHKIGQMLIMGFSGCDIDVHSPVVQWLEKDGLGGVLLFDLDWGTQKPGKNLKTKTQIKQLTQQLNHYTNLQRGSDFKPPLFIALDYEGGAVDRLANINGCMTTMTAHDQALLSDEALYKEAATMAITLKELGFNLNFAPVIDLSLDDQHGIIGKLKRSFSSQPNEVIRAAQQFVTAFSHHGITCAYKHFPGHGSALGDTHHGFVDVTEQYQPSELLPYGALLKDNSLSAMVMTAHVINRQLDETGLPATLSYPILTGLLRREMGFDGVIVSDDLQMQAISNHYPLDEVLCMTINAGADMLIFGNQLGYHTATEVIDQIAQLVQDSAIESDRIEQAYRRILRLKQSNLVLTGNILTC